MSFEPKRRAAHFRLVQDPVPGAVPDQWWVLVANFCHAFNRSPYRNVGRVWANVLRVAANAAFRDVNLAALFDGGK